MIPTQSQFDLLYSDYQQLDTPERFGQYIFNRTGFEIKGSYNETDTKAARYMLRRAVMINQLTPATDWVKCSERMPEHGQRVLWNVKGVMAVGHHFLFGFQDEIHLDSGGYFIVENMDDAEWMPLPTPPQDEHSALGRFFYGANMSPSDLLNYHLAQYGDTKNAIYIKLSDLILQSIYVDFHSKEHLSNWLDETIEDKFEESAIEQFGQQQFDDEICKIANAIADELGLQ
ncbi:DUF551 domain-containing protein [Vitreoscilla massiliensis]|uniref:DUF551 domain-containing protein n=1 Tax=Vitreoscilla massiliensis TaxID=1689272 RepID=A0ABY4E3Z7_9NEIS|nr:DUF551 domain-containing protein [Vitreoscilla massiliensis]UOO89565.1 DUF551 domain-containing protein [Vitreoscilla massiliensis]